MSSPSRFNRVGMSGPPGPQNQSDPFMQIVVVPIPIVATTDEQSTGIFLPPRTYIFEGFLNIISSAAGTGLTLDVGIAGIGVDTLLNNVPTDDSPGFVDEVTAQFQNGGVEVVYTLGGADWTDWVGEVLLCIVASREPV